MEVVEAVWFIRDLMRAFDFGREGTLLRELPVDSFIYCHGA